VERIGGRALESNPTEVRSVDSGRTKKNAGVKKTYPTFPRLKAKKRWGMSDICFHYPLPIVQYLSFYKKDHIFEDKSSRFSSRPDLHILEAKSISSFKNLRGNYLF
jgi:hypothetical protein